MSLFLGMNRGKDFKYSVEGRDCPSLEFALVLACNKALNEHRTVRVEEDLRAPAWSDPMVNFYDITEAQAKNEESRAMSRA